MKIKTGELLNITDGLKNILEEKIPVKPAYWLSRIAKKVVGEFQTFEENRKKLLETYCKKDKDGRPVIKNEQYQFNDIKAFNEEYLKLAEEEIEIDINPIKLEDLVIISKCEKCGAEIKKQVELKPLDLMKVGDIIVGENK